MCVCFSEELILALSLFFLKENLVNTLFVGNQDVSRFDFRLTYRTRPKRNSSLWVNGEFHLV